MIVAVIELQEGKNGTITEIRGGCGVQNQLRSIGIRESKDIFVVTRHPFRGPVVVRIDGKMISLGRGLASRIMVELAD
ncbi:ferrous iron transport protein A [Methanospirillum stamsii]|uniref:Ferrous iron transport protein A n=1 Tax=Methanospirillum stamsii TaxID=1277351 RepID=A0A2V2N4V9_9EURY|nr:FeoA family protein [Methanospirillum stamsii]PWR73630.1 ferrous iron transport protein A [Methanospirillum stamsii]